MTSSAASTNERALGANWARIEERPCRRQQPERHAGEGGVNAGLVDGEPQEQPEDDVDRHRPHAEALGHEQRPRWQQRDGQPAETEVVGVEDGDHDDGADVVGDRQRQQEHLGRAGDPGAESATTATAKAMSVAMGMPQPWELSAPALNSR